MVSESPESDWTCLSLARWAKIVSPPFLRSGSCLMTPQPVPYRRGHPPNPPHASTPEDQPRGPPHPARRLGGADAPPATTEVHILKHRDIWWTVEWDNQGKARHAAAHAPDDEVPPPPHGGDRLTLAVRVHGPPKEPEKHCTTPSTGRRGRQGAPSFQKPTPARTRHATRYAAHIRRHGTGTGHRLLTWPTSPPDALQAAEETLGIMTKQVFQLKDAVPTSKVDVSAAREHPVFASGHAPVQQPEGRLPNPDGQTPGDAKVRRSARPPHRPNPHSSEKPTRKVGPKRKPPPCTTSTP